MGAGGVGGLVLEGRAVGSKTVRQRGWWWWAVGVLSGIAGLGGGVGAGGATMGRRSGWRWWAEWATVVAGGGVVGVAVGVPVRALMWVTMRVLVWGSGRAVMGQWGGRQGFCPSLLYISTHTRTISL